MLVPKVDIKEFEKYGFKKCKEPYGSTNCYYLCVSRGIKMIFLSPVILDITDLDKNDPRIHKRANCKYRDMRTALDIVYELIKADMLERKLP